MRRTSGLSTSGSWLRTQCAAVLLPLAMACSQSGTNGSDMAMTTQGDGSTMPADMAQPDLATIVVSGVAVLAGAAGGIGNADDSGQVARFERPFGAAMDAAGNLYVSDNSRHTIRKIVLSTGAVTTVAGTDRVAGSADGTGTAAQFKNPWGVAIDAAGNLYVADQSNYTIRKIVLSTGAVSTFAGGVGSPGGADGTGAAARFNGPAGLATDSSGNLFVADSGSQTIRQIVLSSAVVTTLAGTTGASGNTDGTGPTARFLNPFGIAADGAGNVYVADSFNHTIRKIVVSTKVVTTLAGSAGLSGTTDGTGNLARFYDPFAVGIDGNGNLFVADTDNHSVRRLVLATNAVTTLAGNGTLGISDGTGQAARFNRPSGVAVDGAGNVYLPDSDNHTVRKVVPASATVTTFAGATSQLGGTDGPAMTSRWNAPGGAVFDGADNLYVSDTENHTVRKIVLSTGVVSTLAGRAGTPASVDGMGTVARFYRPAGLALDGAGNLYVADTSNHTVRKIVLTTSAVSTVAGGASQVGSTDAMGTAARFFNPQSLAFDKSGNLFIADAGNHTVRKFLPSTGAVSTVAGTAGVTGGSDGTGPSAQFGMLGDLTMDGAGNLYVVDQGNHLIRKLVPSTGTVTTLAGMAGQAGSIDGTGSAARFRSPSGIALDPSGNLLIADTNNSTLRRLDPVTLSVTTLAGIAGQIGVKLGPLPARLNRPLALAVSPSGEIVITDRAENVVLIAR